MFLKHLAQTKCTYSKSPSNFSNISNKRFVSFASPPKQSVLITTKIPDTTLQQIQKDFRISTHWNSEEAIPRDVLAKSIEDVDGVLCILENKIDSELLSRAKNLKVISTMSVGFDHIDVSECKSRSIRYIVCYLNNADIAVGNTPGILTETTADLTLALLLATARRIPEGVNAVKDGSWSCWKLNWMCGRDVHHSTVGIIGLGRIGEAVAKRLKGFDCRILYTGNSKKDDIASKLGAQFVDLDTLLKESDFVTAHCPLTPQTKHLFNAETFKKMKPTSILINTTRGGVVNQDDLYDALSNKVIYAAGLDVTTPEPLPPNHKLLTLPNIVILPHIGSASIDTRAKMAAIATGNLISGLNGEAMPFRVV